MMKAKKPTVIAALVMSSLFGTANAMLPIMMLLMGPMMGMGGMTQSKDGHGDPAQGASPAEGRDHASGNTDNPQDSEMPHGDLPPPVLPDPADSTRLE